MGGTVPSGSVGTGMPTCGKTQYLDATGPLTSLTKGSKVTFKVKVTAHHKGHFEFRLCDTKMSSTYSSGFSGSAAEAKQDECFQSHVLHRAQPSEVHNDCVVDDTRGDCQPYLPEYSHMWFLPKAIHEYQAPEDFSDGDEPHVTDMADHPALLQAKANTSYSAGGMYHMTFKLPPDFECTSCTLQFWYRTANSCTPWPKAYRCYFQNMQSEGWSVENFLGGGYDPRWQPAGAWDAKVCAAETGTLNNCGEQFKNCADVSISSSGSGPSPTPVAATPVPTSAAANPTPEPQPEPAPTPSPASSGGTATQTCKDQCQDMCVARSGGVATNQGWGSPRYIECKCSDGYRCVWPGCECENGGCSDEVVNAPVCGGSTGAPAQSPTPEPASEPSPTQTPTAAPTP